MSGPPILLFGAPRSGTSWLGRILDSHPDTLMRHEPDRSEEHTSELQSHAPISYAVFCLKKKK